MLANEAFLFNLFSLILSKSYFWQLHFLVSFQINTEVLPSRYITRFWYLSFPLWCCLYWCVPSNWEMFKILSEWIGLDIFFYRIMFTNRTKVVVNWRHMIRTECIMFAAILSSLWIQGVTVQWRVGYSKAGDVTVWTVEFFNCGTLLYRALRIEILAYTWRSVRRRVNMHSLKSPESCYKKKCNDDHRHK